MALGRGLTHAALAMPTELQGCCFTSMSAISPRNVSLKNEPLSLLQAPSEGKKTQMHTHLHIDLTMSPFRIEPIRS